MLVVLSLNIDQAFENFLNSFFKAHKLSTSFNFCLSFNCLLSSIKLLIALINLFQKLINSDLLTELASQKSIFILQIVVANSFL
ncbi:hypothetical protein HOG21_02025 [bacterium]|nr:hypothetical protein [bacterium]